MAENQAVSIAQVLYDRKAQDIVALNVGHMTVLCEQMILATGYNHLQVKALADYVDMKCAEMGIERRRVEGAADGKWIVLDYGHILVHIFVKNEREYYRLDRLWDDGTNRIALPFDTEQA